MISITNVYIVYGLGSDTNIGLLWEICLGDTNMFIGIPMGYWVILYGLVKILSNMVIIITHVYIVYGLVGDTNIGISMGKHVYGYGKNMDEIWLYHIGIMDR